MTVTVDGTHEDGVTVTVTVAQPDDEDDVDDELAEVEELVDELVGEEVEEDDDVLEVVELDVGLEIRQKWTLVATDGCHACYCYCCWCCWWLNYYCC